ncbi:MAG: LysE family translocator [Thiofilum sp.]|uniref:LysE family translocator n=1 Tax=Thiofilum sp. TaxID=2212733 RepID=UPI0025DA7222|nr:LysE family translocator [Thiofilum sp.]MBK8455501.1 LysE family translocator [Thiofilum sp.]
MSLLLTALVLGLYAGFSPGPMLTLVLSETLKHGTKAGLQVALSPLITDVPIIILALVLMNQLAQMQTALGIMSLVGALVLIWMGYESLNTQPIAINNSSLITKPASLKKGILVNLVNPHPYIFWITIGAPLIYKAYQQSLGLALVALLGFYICLVGAKVLLALIAGRYRHALSSQLYLMLVRGLGLVLWLFAVFMAWEGFKLLTK